MRPKIVCLCGSTKFWEAFQKESLRLTLEGVIVLSIGAATASDDSHFGSLPKPEYDRVKASLDELHKRKIDLADEVLVLNVGDYIGESTRSEIEYAILNGKMVHYAYPHGPRGLLLEGFLKTNEAWGPAPPQPLTCRLMKWLSEVKSMHDQFVSQGNEEASMAVAACHDSFKEVVKGYADDMQAYREGTQIKREISPSGKPE